MKIKVTLLGTKAMLQHNERLSNPVDPYTRELKKITSKRKKTDEDLIRIMQIEARGGCWEDEAGYVGIKTSALYRAILDSARQDKLGKQIERGLRFEEKVERLTMHDGRQYLCDDYLSNPAHIDYRGVKIGKSRTMRSRPIISSGWRATCEFDLLLDVLDLDMLVPSIDRAGELFGIGDGRVLGYGKFKAEVSS